MEKIVYENLISEYKIKLMQEVLNAPQLSIELTREWTKTFPREAGIYLLWENNELCYVGETGSIRGRMQNLLNTLNHQVRRSIANKQFKNHKGFVKGSSTQKHPDEIEKLLDKYIIEQMQVSFLPISFGRKEIEEAICALKKPCYNSREKRK